VSNPNQQVLTWIEGSISPLNVLTLRFTIARRKAKVVGKKKEHFCHIPVYSVAPVVSIRLQQAEA
jgi:hypothetical protein